MNQLNFTEAKKDAWAAVLQKYQTETIICNSPLSYKGMQPCPLLPVNSSWPGFYTLEGSSGGWEPWREYRSLSFANSRPQRGAGAARFQRRHHGVVPSAGAVPGQAEPDVRAHCVQPDPV